MKTFATTAIVVMLALAACDRATQTIEADADMSSPQIERMAENIEDETDRELFRGYVERRADGEVEAEMITVADAIEMQREYVAVREREAAKAAAAAEATAAARAAAEEARAAQTAAADLSRYVTIEFRGDEGRAPDGDIALDFRILNRSDRAIERVSGIATFFNEDGSEAFSYPLRIEDEIGGGRTVEWSGTKAFERSSDRDRAFLRTVRSSDQFRFQPTGIAFTDGSSVGDPIADL